MKSLLLSHMTFDLFQGHKVKGQGQGHDPKILVFGVFMNQNCVLMSFYA